MGRRSDCRHLLILGFFELFGGHGVLGGFGDFYYVFVDGFEGFVGGVVVGDCCAEGGAEFVHVGFEAGYVGAEFGYSGLDG